MSEEHTTQQTSSATNVSRANSNLGIPIAIVIAAALIAGAIYMSNEKQFAQVNVEDGIATAQKSQKTAEMEVAPVTKEDHIRGNPNADIMIIEYSDFDCPFCKNFHETMTKIIAEYGKNGNVAWVYRPFPINQLHPNATKIAAASECVAEIGGNDAFWKFADKIFEDRAVNAQTDITKLPGYAQEAGVSVDAFNTCLTNGTYDEKIQNDIEAAVKAGAQGTPYSVVTVGGQQGVINGAQPYEVVKGIVDNLLGQLKAAQ